MTTEQQLRDKLRKITLIMVQPTRGVGVGPGLEGIFSLQFKQDGNFLENVGDLRFIHGEKGV